MKILKGSVLIVFVLVIGFATTFLSTPNPTYAQFESVVGRTVDGPEFIKITMSPKIIHYIHKNEVSNLSMDETQGTNSLKYLLNLNNGKQISINKDLFDTIASQLDFVEIIPQ